MLDGSFAFPGSHGSNEWGLESGEPFPGSARKAPCSLVIQGRQTLDVSKRRAGDIITMAPERTGQRSRDQGVRVPGRSP